MATFEEFLSEGKKLQIKRKYTENHPAQTVGKTASVRNAVLQAIKDGVVTREEFNKILSELSTSANQWASRNRKYFNVSEDGVKLSKWGRRILAELDETPKTAEVFEATVEMDALNPDDKDFLKFLKKNRVKIINKVMDGPGGGTPVITMQGKRKDLEKVLADPELGWDDPDLAEYIEESVVNEKIKVTKDKFPYIEFKDGGKKYEVEFDQGDIIDDHGNEGKDWYYVGVDQFGDEWEIDVYTDYRDEPEDWFHDTIKRVDESAITENYEVIWSDGMRGMKKFRNERQARQYFDDKIKQKGMRDVALYRAGSGFHSTTQTEYVIAFWGNGTYLDNVSKKDADLAAKKVEESVVNEAFKFGTKNQYTMDDVNDGYGFWGTLGLKYDEKEIQDHWLVAFIHLTLNWGFSDAGALYFLNAKSGRWLADQVNDRESMNFDLVDIMDDYAKPSQWKKWAKEYNKYAQEELAENNNTNMKTEFLFESFEDFVGANFVNEALGSQIMAQIFMSNKQGKAAANNIKTLAKGFYGMAKVALDKIQDEDFIISNDPGKVFKNYGGPNHILFFISDNEKENPYYPTDSYGSLRTIPGGGILLAAMSGDRMFFANEWSKWSRDKTWTKRKKGDESQIGVSHRYKGWDATGLNNGKRISEVSDRVIVLNLDLVRQKYSTQQLRDARAAAKAGATAFKSDKDFKKANQARYHEILAQKAASLPLDSMVEGAIDKLTKQIQDGLKAGDKTQYNEIKIGQSPKGRDVKARDAASHMSNILDDYQRYCDYIKRAEESEARYGERESYYEREAKDYAKRIKDKINKIDTFDYAW